MRYIVVMMICFMGVQISAEEELKCDGIEFRQLDFWIGEWDVIDQATGKQVGTSRIEKRLKGCTIFETWTGADDFLGHSFNLYNREIKKWQQVWTDSRGQRIDFTGEMKADGIHYQGPFRTAGKEVLASMKFLRLPNGNVRQLWEQSSDQGKTWNVAFDGLYVPKKR